MALIYIVDDEENMCKALKFSLESADHDVEDFTDARAAISRIKDPAAATPDIIISDLKMPEIGGIEFLSEVKKIDIHIPFIIMTAHATVKNAVEAMKEGAFDYILKPFEPDELKILIKKAIEHSRLEAENIALKSFAEEVNFIGSSPSISSVLDMLDNVAPSKTTVLITGESGTGKELIAKLIHLKSDRARKPFIKINCAAIPDSLLESELFGHKKGSFTGAISDKIGKFELADTGTIFLDEIGDMNLNLQSKLLRVLQERQFEKVGGNRSQTVDVRIIAATNQNLQKMISEGQFREDLYYRLNVFPIKVPPLRERREDVISITWHFIKKFNSEFKKNVATLGQDMNAFLLKYSFPGNVRELSNLVERAMILVRGTELNMDHIDKNDFSIEKPEPKNAETSPDAASRNSASASLEQIEREHIVDILRSTGWHKGKAAEILKVDRSTLYRMMKKYNIEPKE
ncbi:MAG TPA: sigma-54 dependent transcriptional regulator [Candidatus Wallbacteria bacterium]|nr:sigma-54 dependent transcriptional regulator [Candidatus Wallbacteria bacterium]